MDFKVENFFLNGKTEKEAKEKQRGRERKNEKEMIRMLKGEERRGEERRGEERRGEERLA